MADGGEGTLTVVGGTVRHSRVTGPLGGTVEAEWHLLDRPSDGPGPTAVVEMAEAAGRALVPAPAGDDPVRASTRGVGELILDAVHEGARRVVVAVGGSATTDGGSGALAAIGSPNALDGAELVVACDVSTRFLQAATVFGPQKGARPAQVAELTARLGQLAERYQRDFGVDVTTLDGGGAAGGLAGGLAAFGARLLRGFDLVAELVDLDERLAPANLVVTGEGRLDLPSFEGKVVGGVIERVAGRVPVLCVVGRADADALGRLPEGVELVDLVAMAGEDRAMHETGRLIAEVVADRCTAR